MTLDTFALHHPTAMLALSIPLMLTTMIGLPILLMVLILGA